MKYVVVGVLCVCSGLAESAVVVTSIGEMSGSRVELSLAELTETHFQVQTFDSGFPTDVRRYSAPNIDIRHLNEPVDGSSGGNYGELLRTPGPNSRISASWSFSPSAPPLNQGMRISFDTPVAEFGLYTNDPAASTRQALFYDVNGDLISDVRPTYVEPGDQFLGLLSADRLISFVEFQSVGGVPNGFGNPGIVNTIAYTVPTPGGLAFLGLGLCCSKRRVR
jgi:hypothetical protein